MKTVEEWIAHWNGKTGITDPVELNGYCVAGKPIPYDTYRRAVIEPCLARLELEPHHHVLDIGCGSGLMLAEMAGHVTRCVGVDPSVAMIERYTGPAETYVAAADSLPFEPGSFDRVLMVGVALYFPSDAYFAAVLRNVLDLLRRDGIFLASDLLLGQPIPSSQYRYYDRDFLSALLDSLDHPYSIVVQNKLKRSINRRYDIIIYKD